MKRSHGFSFLPGARAKNFRVDRYPVSPEDLQEEGRVWYGEDDDALRYSKTESGLLVPRRVLDSEPKWADLTAPINPDSGVGVSTPSWEAFRGDFSAMLFLANKSQSVQVAFHINHDYALGTEIFPHVHWTNKVPGETGTVRWGVDLLVAQGHQQDNFNGVIDTIYIEQAGVGGTLDHMVAESSVGFYDPRLEPDTLVYCRIFRDSGHPNDTAGNVYGLTIDMHYQLDDVGTPSRSPDFYARD